MGRIFAIILVMAFFVVTTGCGDDKEINGVKYGTYGLWNEDQMKNPEIQYETIIGNIVWGIILCETIVAPIYFFGFSLYDNQ